MGKGPGLDPGRAGEIVSQVELEKVAGQRRPGYLCPHNPDQEKQQRMEG